MRHPDMFAFLEDAGRQLRAASYVLAEKECPDGSETYDEEAADQERRYRQNRIRGYTHQVMSFGTMGKGDGYPRRTGKTGARRLAFFEANPISEIATGPRW